MTQGYNALTRMTVFACLLLSMLTATAQERTTRIRNKQAPGYIFRITLCDKAGSPYSLNHPLRFLSKRSVERRQRQHLPIDTTDLPVSQQYIKMLEKTLFYKDWATAQRRFLYNDKAVEEDPEYGSKRRSLPKDTREFIQARGPYYDLLLTIRTNPKATAARDYAIGYLLLANDVPHINSFIEEFYGTEAMPQMPLRLQEAAVAANEKDLDWCRSHGVDEKVIEDYQALRSTLLQTQSAQGNVPEVLMRWRYTYWYYLLVTSPNMAKMREALQRRQQQQDSQQISAH